MKLLIAGAGGILGRELVRQSLDRGDDVSALVLNRRELDGMEHPRLRILEADVTKPSQLEGVCTDQEQVISCIGITRIKGKLTHEDVDYRGNLNLLQEAGKQGVGRFGFISPAGTEEGHDEAPLLDAKYRFEQALRTSGIPWVLFRSGGFFPDLAEMKALAKKGPLYSIGRSASKCKGFPRVFKGHPWVSAGQFLPSFDLSPIATMPWVACFSLCPRTRSAPHISARSACGTIWLNRKKG